MAFVERMAFSRIHVFPYSPRAGTPAAVMPNQIAKADKHRRAGEMIALGERLMRQAYEALLGRVEPVLLEEKVGGCMAGYTPGYARVLVRDTERLPGELVWVQLDGIEQDALLGRPVNKEDAQ